MFFGERCRKRNGLYRHADEWASHMAALEQLVEDAVDRRGGQCQRSTASRGRVVQTEDSSGRVDERSTGKPVVDRKIQPEDAIDARALPAAPSFADSADNAKAGRDIRAWTSHRQNQRADAEACRVCFLANVRFRAPALDPPCNQVGGRIATGNFGAGGLSARSSPWHFVVSAH